MPIFVEYLADQALELGEVEKRDAQRLTVRNLRGRVTTVSADKVWFEHQADSAEALIAARDALAATLDIELLWQTLCDGEADSAWHPAALADLYFGQRQPLQASAVYAALTEERTHFRRRGESFEPRSAPQIEQLRQQRAAEEKVRADTATLRQALAQKTLADDLAQRLERFVRGQADRLLEELLSEGSTEPRQRAFLILVDHAAVPATADFEIYQAGLNKADPPAVGAWLASHPPQGVAQIAPDSAHAPCALTIDDAATREVDDGLTLARDGELVRVDIDIADAAAFVPQGTPVDQEALRRSATAYLPTATYYMLPEVIGCDVGSLVVGKVRPAVRCSVWFDAAGAQVRYRFSRTLVTVARRLSYEEADALIDDGADDTASMLRALATLADARRAERVAQGAWIMQRREWSICVRADGEAIEVKPLETDTPSRRLVAEMMIVANTCAAAFAVQHGLPLIFRAQPAPSAPLPAGSNGEPPSAAQLRGLIPPASLSLHAAPHWGLGVAQYTQSTSPLRRYVDLVAQRQISAQLAGEPPPYDAPELLEVLATVEANERQLKRVEWATEQRWALEYLAREAPRDHLAAEILAEAGGGYRVVILCCGAQGFLACRTPLALGAQVTVRITDISPRRHALRLALQA